MIEFTFLKILILIEEAHQKSVIFVTIGISWVVVLSFNQMSAIDAMTCIAVLKIKGSDHRSFISLISKNETIYILENADLTQKSGKLSIENSRKTIKILKSYITIEKTIITFGDIEI